MEMYIGTSYFDEVSVAAERGSWDKLKPPQVDGLYNRKGDIFDHFGSAFNNMKFRLFCPFLTIPLRTN